MPVPIGTQEAVGGGLPDIDSVNSSVNPPTNKSFEFAAILREGALLETSF